MNISAIVLAAGKGTRMKSILPKVLHPVFFKPMVCHVLDSLQKLDLNQIIVVTGHEHEIVEQNLASYSLDFVLQEEQNGTGHAVQLTQSALEESTEHVLIVCGDSPLISEHTLQLMIEDHVDSAADVTVLSTEVADPTHYGRMVCDANNQLVEIVEEKDADAKQKQIKEINGGIYIVRREILFATLAKINTANAQGELYLTDIVRLAREDGHAVSRVICENAIEIMGVNSRQELVKAHDILQNSFFDHLLDNGVSLVRPLSSSIHPSTVIGADTTIFSNVTLSKSVIIGSFCQISDQCYIENSYIGDNVIIGAGCKLIGVKVSSNSIIQPASIMICENEINVS